MFHVKLLIFDLKKYKIKKTTANNIEINNIPISPKPLPKLITSLTIPKTNKIENRRKKTGEYFIILE